MSNCGREEPLMNFYLSLQDMKKQNTSTCSVHWVHEVWESCEEGSMLGDLSGSQSRLEVKSIRGSRCHGGERPGGPGTKVEVLWAQSHTVIGLVPQRHTLNKA